MIDPNREKQGSSFEPKIIVFMSPINTISYFIRLAFSVIDIPDFSELLCYDDGTKLAAKEIDDF